MSLVERLRKRRVPALTAICCMFWGCPLESRVPLSSSESGTIDPEIVGEWRCVSPDSEKMALLTIAPFDERQYYVGAAYEGSLPVPFRAYSSKLEGRTLVNLKALANVGPPFAESWFIARYSRLQANVLRIDLVGREGLQGDSRSAAELRGKLLSRLEDASTYEQYAVCIRVPIPSD